MYDLPQPNLSCVAFHDLLELQRTMVQRGWSARPMNRAGWYLIVLMLSIAAFPRIALCDVRVNSTLDLTLRTISQHHPIRARHRKLCRGGGLNGLQAGSGSPRTRLGQPSPTTQMRRPAPPCRSSVRESCEGNRQPQKPTKHLPSCNAGARRVFPPVVHRPMPYIHASLWYVLG